MRDIMDRHISFLIPDDMLAASQVILYVSLTWPHWRARV